MSATLPKVGVAEPRMELFANDAICIKVQKESIGVSVPTDGNKHHDEWHRTVLCGGRLHVYTYDNGDLIWLELKREKTPVRFTTPDIK